MRRALIVLLIGCGAATPVHDAPPDSDHDGVIDAHDACPCDPEDADQFEDGDGCPDWDDDQDRIPDACDACPREAESYDGVCDEDGCPETSPVDASEPFSLLERVEFAEGSAEIRPEVSSVLDDIVRAINGHPTLGPLHALGQRDAHEPHREGLALSRAQAVVAELARRGVDPARMIAEVDPAFVTSDPHTLPRYVRFEIPQPAPASATCRSTLCATPWTPPAPVCSTAPLDRDHDGVDDAHDVCPCHAEDHDGWQDGDGCPDPDNDGDRIVDACDLCPNDPETYQGHCDEDGCPDRSHVCIERAEIQIVQYVRFARGSATPLPESLPWLDEIASTLNENPELTRVAMLGESDAHEPHHATLALARAQAVLEALVTRGIARDRLVAEASTFVHAPTDPPEASRRVGMEVRSFDAPSSSACAPSPCEVRACEPPPEPPPAC